MRYIATVSIWVKIGYDACIFSRNETYIVNADGEYDAERKINNVVREKMGEEFSSLDVLSITEEIL